MESLASYFGPFMMGLRGAPDGPDSFTDEFKAKIEQGESDLREGLVRIRKP